MKTNEMTRFQVRWSICIKLGKQSMTLTILAGSAWT